MTDEKFNLKLKAEKREIFSASAKAMADKDNKILGILYGSKTENQPLFVNLGEFKKVWKQAGESTIVELEFQTKNIPVLIYSVGLDPLSNEPRHVDFYAVDMSKKITASVPLSFVGESPAVKIGGILVKVLHELEVEALPKDLPSELEADISSLKTFEDKITTGDIKVAGEVKIMAEPDEMVAFVEKAAEEEIEEPEQETKIEDIEATKEKGKEKEEKTKEEDKKGEKEEEKKIKE